jgi:hypothetical protein
MSVKWDWDEIDHEPMRLDEVLVAVASVGCFFAALYGCIHLAVFLGQLMGRC